MKISAPSYRTSELNTVSQKTKTISSHFKRTISNYTPAIMPGRTYPPWKFVHEQFKTLHPTTADLIGRTIIVTGANVGLGKEAARQYLAMKPAKLILAVRDIKKGQDAADSIIKSEKETRHDIVQVWQLDLASFESVRAFSERANNELERLDILLENAGIAAVTFRKTADGHEASMQANVISTGLLGLLLLPLLQKTAKLPQPGPPLKPHLTLVSSAVHYWATFHSKNEPNIIKALDDESRWASEGGDRYNVTKLLDLFLAREIGKLSLAKDVVVSSVNPGFCLSSLTREMNSNPISRFAEKIIGRSETVGVYNYIWATLIDHPSGSFVSNCHIEEVSVFAASPEGYQAQDKIWKELSDIWTLVAPEVMNVLG